jgi:hypothetical protein
MSNSLEEQPWQNVSHRRKKNKQLGIFATPKTLFVGSRQYPVWEITSSGKAAIYFERVHYEGYRPIGSTTFNIGTSHVTVCDPVVYTHIPRVLLEADGFFAHNSWYEPDPTYQRKFMNVFL